MQELSHDTLGCIIRDVPGYDLLSLAQTSTTLNSKLNQRNIWASKLKREFPVEAWHFMGDEVLGGDIDASHYPETVFCYQTHDNLKSVYINLLQTYYPPNPEAPSQSVQERLGLKGRLRFAAIYGDNAALLRELRALCHAEDGPKDPKLQTLSLPELIKALAGTNTLKQFTQALFEADDEVQYLKWAQSRHHSGEGPGAADPKVNEHERLTPFYLAVFNNQVRTVELQLQCLSLTEFGQLKYSMYANYFSRYIGPTWSNATTLGAPYGFMSTSSAQPTMDIFTWACRAGDHAEMLRVIDQYTLSVVPYIDTAGIYRNNNWKRHYPLQLAIRMGRIQCVQYWLHHHMTIDQYDVMIAMECRQREILEHIKQTIVAHPLPPEKQTRWLSKQVGAHGSMLHFAAFCADIQTAEWLLTMGADIDQAHETSSATPINFACLNGQTEMVQHLLSLGATADQSTAAAALRSNNDDIITLIKECAGISKQAISQALPYIFLEIAGSNNTEILTRLRPMLNQLNEAEIRMAIDRDPDEPFTAPPLLLATKTNHTHAMRLLCELGANVNITYPNSNTTPLHVACQYGLEDAVEVLLEYHADATLGNQFDDYSTEPSIHLTGVTPLHLSCYYNQPAILTRLIATGINVDQSLDQGLTGLHIACYARSIECAKILLRHHANIESRAYNQATPLILAAGSGSLDMVMLLCEAGADLDAKNATGTALHFACRNQHPELVVYLIQKGADMTIENEEGVSALQMILETPELHQQVIEAAELKQADEVLAALLPSLNLGPKSRVG